MTLDQMPAPRGDAGPSPTPETEPTPSEPTRRERLRQSTWYRRLRRPWVVIPVVAIVAFAVWYFAIRSDGSSPSATTTTTKQLITVTRGALTNDVSAEGTVASAQTDDLSFSSSGTVTAVNVKAGDTVTAGQVLATIDSSSLQSALASAGSTLAKTQATLSDDESSGASSDQISADQTAVTTATDAVAKAWQNLAGASLVATFNGTVSTVNLTVGEQLSSSGSGATTPTGSGTGSGQSSSTLGSGGGGGNGGNNNNGNNSSSSSPQIEVVSSGQYTVSLPVSSSDIASIKSGDTATLTVTTATGGRFGGFGGGGGFFRLFAGAGGGGGGGGGGNGSNRAGTGTGNGQNGTGNNSANTGATASGTVTDVGQVASASSGVAQYPITVTFATTNPQFAVGSTVTGAIQSVVANDVLEVPVRAISTDSNGHTTVQVSLDGSTTGKTATRTVQTGRTAGGNIEITSGLKEGDQVIVTTVVPAGLTGGGSGTRGTFGGTGRFPGFGGSGGGTGTSGAGADAKGGAGG